MNDIVCPYCGNEDYECYDKTGNEALMPIYQCVCCHCGKDFEIIYKVVEIRRVE